VEIVCLSIPQIMFIMNVRWVILGALDLARYRFEIVSWENKVRLEPDVTFDGCENS